MIKRCKFLILGGHYIITCIFMCLCNSALPKKPRYHKYQTYTRPTRSLQPAALQVLFAWLPSFRVLLRRTPLGRPSINPVHPVNSRDHVFNFLILWPQSSQHRIIVRFRPGYSYSDACICIYMTGSRPLNSNYSYAKSEDHHGLFSNCRKTDSKRIGVSRHIHEHVLSVLNLAL